MRWRRVAACCLKGPSLASARPSLSDFGRNREFDRAGKHPLQLAPAGIMHVGLKPCSYHQRLRFTFSKGQCVLHIDGQHLAVPHQDLSVNNHRVHIAAKHLVNQAVDRHPVGG